MYPPDRRSLWCDENIEVPPPFERSDSTLVIMKTGRSPVRRFALAASTPQPHSNLSESLLVSHLVHQQSITITWSHVVVHTLEVSEWRVLSSRQRVLLH